MGEDEKQQLVASLFKQHRTETQNLACINAKSTQILKNIAMVSRPVNDETTGSFKGGRFRIHQQPNGV